ncbi:methyltransferase domain-containing protein [Candidatus Thorarchaeota archaeon]|nr:MAG: methyltransferase domain-containing protein [Candidatus Thorarchaeota archaeon]
MDNLAKADWADPERVQSLAESYNRRYGVDFWSAFCDIIRNPHPDVVADFGCGPGLFLVDSVKKLGATAVYGFDESGEMLSQAEEFLLTVLPQNKIALQKTDFDDEQIELESSVINLAFSGYVIHEVKNPLKLLERVKRTLCPNGEYVLLDFISGKPEAFVQAMIEQGMDESQARARYPHMCKNSLDDLHDLLLEAGFEEVRHRKTHSFRGILSGVKRHGAD